MPRIANRSGMINTLLSPGGAANTNGGLAWLAEARGTSLTVAARSATGVDKLNDVSADSSVVNDRGGRPGINAGRV